MPELVSQIQSSFVPSRQTSNNMLIVQEVVYTMRNKKGKTENMAIRIDLEKTYDQLSWEVIQDNLEDVGISYGIKRLI